MLRIERELNIHSVLIGDDATYIAAIQREANHGQFWLIRGQFTFHFGIGAFAGWILSTSSPVVMTEKSRTRCLHDIFQKSPDWGVPRNRVQAVAQLLQNLQQLTGQVDMIQLLQILQQLMDGHRKLLVTRWLAI
jgi:hypothetical protein